MSKWIDRNILMMEEDELFLEVSSEPDSNGTVEVPPETLVMLGLLQLCGGARVLWRRGERPGCARVALPPGSQPVGDAGLSASCRPPALLARRLSAGLCAAARRLARRAPAPKPPLHPHGLLGFRAGCLQAPNETSVWTKFCEIQIPAVTANMLTLLRQNYNTEETVLKIPENIIKFEYHLTKPIRVHNVYKLAHDVAKMSVTDNPPVKSLSEEVENLSDKEVALTNEGENNKTPRNTAKQRKWKSKKTIAHDSFSVENLNSLHNFAEGPYVTLADVILYSCLYLILIRLNRVDLENLIPKTLKWFERLHNLDIFEPINNFLQVTDKLTFAITEKQDIKFNVIIDDTVVENSSLYKHDPKRSGKKKKMFTKEEDIEKALDLITESLELDWSATNDEFGHEIDWAQIPADASPFGGHLPDDRMQRKTEQLGNLASAVLKIAKEGNVIVDFCSGGGHLGILLGYLLPKCTIILLENKEQSLKRAQIRVEKLKLSNIYFIQCNLDFFIAPFDIGVALHACGVSTDLVLENCIDKKAAFVICPCCYGSVHETDRLKYPRSHEFSFLPVEQYVRLGHAADQTHVNHPLEKRGTRCMSIIDSDRARHAMSRGYSVTLRRLKPLSCTPKNMLLVGIPR